MTRSSNWKKRTRPHWSKDATKNQERQRISKLRQKELRGEIRFARDPHSSRPRACVERKERLK